jgi:acrylyl-CoA reductase (NADPH)
MLPATFRCLYVQKDAQGHIDAAVNERPFDELPPGEVVIRVAYSSYNYKDALATQGHPGVAKRLPHVPGVDAAGTVSTSQSHEFAEDDCVLVTGYGMGSDRWGGLAEFIRVPGDWVVPVPAGLSLHDCMAIGTAGLTAALCCETLQRHGIAPGDGEVVVTGASGGVGSMAVAILAKLGYHVVAVTGKPSAHDYLRLLGARDILPRTAVDDHGSKPLLSGRWAGAIDTVGGNLLATVLRSTRHSGCVTACGLAGGSDLPLTVYPFILRGVVLAGIDTALIPMPLRRELWQRLAGPWRPACLETMVQTADLASLPRWADEFLAGRVRGRVLVKIAGEEDCGR